MITQIVQQRPFRTIVVSGMAVLLLAACSSSTTRQDLEDYHTQADSLSVETATGVVLRYTDSARLKALITAPLTKRYPQADEPYIEMPEGLKARFFDENGVENSWLRASYGKNFEQRKLVELRNQVHVKNKEGEELESEELFWDQRSKKIYTDKFVKITRKDELIYGEGLESNETFTRYRIKRPSGRVKLKE